MTLWGLLSKAKSPQAGSERNHIKQTSKHARKQTTASKQTKASKQAEGGREGGEEGGSNLLKSHQNKTHQKQSTPQTST